MPPSRAHGLWPALGGIVVTAGFSYLVLRVEQEWEVVALAADALIGLFAFNRGRLPGRVQAGWAAAPGLLSGLALVAGFALIGAFYEDHFALLMLTKVMLFGLACIGLTLQFGFAGVVNP